MKSGPSLLTEPYRKHEHSKMGDRTALVLCFSDEIERRSVGTRKLLPLFRAQPEGAGLTSFSRFDHHAGSSRRVDLIALPLQADPSVGASW
jgi:hypothetical protein